MFEGIIERLQAFMLQHGGTAAVANSIGKHPNKFYVMFRGETKPTLTTIAEIVAKYPNLDLNWLITGIKSGEKNYEELVMPKSELEKKVKQFELENQKLKEELDDIKQEKKKLFDLLGKSESMTKSLFVDSEKGVNVMNALLGQQTGHALSKRMQ